MVLTIGSTKGGVGKTALTASLGTILTYFSQRAPQVDADVLPISSSCQSVEEPAAAGLHQLPSEILSARGFTHGASIILRPLAPHAVSRRSHGYLRGGQLATLISI